MSETFPPRRPRRPPFLWLAIMVMAVGAGGLWVWLGQRLPENNPVILAVAHLTPATGDQPALKPSTASSASPLLVRPDAEPKMPTSPDFISTLPAPAPVPPKVSAAAPPPIVAPPSAAPVAVAPAAAPLAQVASPPPPAAATNPPPVPPVPAVATVPPPAVAPTPLPSFDIVRVTPRGEAVLAGRAAPGSTVTITDNGRKIAEATGDSEGQWVALPTTSLPEGGQQLALSSVAPSGQKLDALAPLLVIVPPARSDPAASSVNTAVAILTPPVGAPRVLQGLAPAPSDHAGANRVTLDIVDYDEHGAIRFGGVAPPGASIRAYVDNQAAGEAHADAEGHWSVEPAASVAAGTHRLRIDQLTGAGKVAARVELPFERTELAAMEMREGRIVVQPRATLWRIARQAYGQGVRYTVIYQANRDQIRDPNMIFPGQVFSIPPSTTTP